MTTKVTTIRIGMVVMMVMVITGTVLLLLPTKIVYGQYTGVFPQEYYEKAQGYEEGHLERYLLEGEIIMYVSEVREAINEGNTTTTTIVTEEQAGCSCSCN